MRLKPCLLAIALLAVDAHAVEHVFPTEIYVGDCVSPRILASRTAIQERQDREHCVEQNLGHPEPMRDCLDYLRDRSDIAFFWDHCGSPDGPFQIGLNGRTVDLTKVVQTTSREIWVAGVYEAPGLRVKIAPGRLLRRSTMSLEEGGDVEYEVFLTVTHDGVADRIRGMFWYGH